MNRPILIAGGCVLGLGGILIVTPPQFGNSSLGLPSASSPPTSTTTTQSTLMPTSKPTPTKPAGITGVFSGGAFNTPYGPVQVQITLQNGTITATRGLQYPNNSFRDKSINSQAIPYLIQETLAAQSANIQGVGGASYTSGGWKQSLASALAKAGM